MVYFFQKKITEEGYKYINTDTFAFIGLENLKGILLVKLLKAAIYQRKIIIFENNIVIIYPNPGFLKPN